MGKLINEDKTLLEEMISNNYNQASERVNSRKGGRHEVDAFIMLAHKVDLLFQNVDHLQTNPSQLAPIVAHLGI